MSRPVEPGTAEACDDHFEPAPDCRFAAARQPLLRRHTTIITPATLKAVLLDVDGTLLDSNDAHARSWVAVLARHGHACDYSRVRPLIGKGGDKLLPELIGIGPGDRAFTQISDERTALS